MDIKNNKNPSDIGKSILQGWEVQYHTPITEKQFVEYLENFPIIVGETKLMTIEEIKKRFGDLENL